MERSSVLKGLGSWARANVVNELGFTNPLWGAVNAFCLLAAAFVIFSFRAPRLGIFRDPLTGGFGLFSNTQR